MQALGAGATMVGTVLPQDDFPLIVRPIGSHAGQNLEKMTHSDDLADYLARVQPDLLLLQELKCEETAFPAGFAELGYHAEIVGQKAYNGVAILSRLSIK